MLRGYLLAGLCFISIGTWAQGLSGYVVTTAGDTLRGGLKEKRDGRVALYAGKGQPQIFGPEQLLGYGMGRQVVIRSYPVRLVGGGVARRFAVPQLQGPASLYVNPNEQGLLLRPAASDTLTELSAANWHVAFNRHLSGCPTLDQADPKLLALPYSNRNLSDVVGRYNRCVTPGWKPQRQRTTAVWQRSHSVYVGAVRLHHTPDKNDWDDRAASGPGWQVAGEWNWQRSNGTQTSTQLEYTQINLQTSPYVTEYLGGQPVTEQRQRIHGGLIAGTVTFGQRLGRPQRPNLWLGGGAGLTLGLPFLTRREVQERPAGGAAAFQTVAKDLTISVGPGGGPHLEALAGVLLPLAERRELRLNALYRNYVLGHLSLWGVQVAYSWRKSS